MKIPAEIAIAGNKPFGARFYKCALQVNPYSYAQYRGHTPMGEDEYNDQILDVCKKNKIEIVGLADHGCVDGSETLRKLLSSKGILVFPGFEICSAEKIHMVCLFATNTPAKKLNQILGALQDGSIDDRQKTHPAKKTLLEIAEQVVNENGIWYAAHMEEDNGLLKTGSFWNIWKEEKWVLAGQIKSTVEDLDMKFSQIIKNKNADYKRINKISVINAKDIESPETLSDPRASCMIKMSEPGIEALHQAFLDGDSRIRLNSEITTTHHSKIETVSIIGGGFFGDGIHVHFNSNLNTIIGGRGTGKSTILECIRYGLDAEYHSDRAKERADEILENNLYGGKVTLLVFSNRFEKRFIVERHYNQPVIIKNEDGAPSNQTIDDILPGIEIFGQNEIFEVSEDKSYHVKLIDRFLPENTNQHISIIRQLKQNRQKLVQAYDKLDELEGENKQFNRLNEQQKALQQLGLDKKFKESDIYNLEQKRLLSRSNQDLAALGESASAFTEIVNDTDTQYLSDESIKDIINKDIFAGLRKDWNELLKNLKLKNKEISKLLEEFEGKINEHSSNWVQRHQKFNSEFEKLVGKLPDSGGKKGGQIAKEYSLISQKLAAIQGINKDLINQQKIVSALEKERKSLISELDDLLLARFNQLSSTIKKLNKNKLSGRLQIVVMKNNDKRNLEVFLKGLPGIGAKKTTWINESESITIRQLVQDIKEGEETLTEKYAITPAIAQALSEMGRIKLLELEEVVLEDQVDIRLNVGTDALPRFADIDDLSSGQSCTAILNLLMLDNPDPLIVDQPEDNLDNAFIAYNIVGELRKQKENRQFIFSTHNANIPVFGDAEWIGAMAVEEGTSVLPDDCVGSIDKESLRPKVEEILEGGKSAFEIRRLKYGF